MAEQQSKPTTSDTDQPSPTTTPAEPFPARRFLPLGLGLIVLVVGCFWWGNQAPQGVDPLVATTPTVAETDAADATSPPSQAAAAVTRVASSLIPPTVALPTPTATAAAASALVPLPTVTPTIIPSPVATRAVEFAGDATLRLRLNADNVATGGQPLEIALEPRSYVLGGDTMSQNDEWCMQVGPTGVVFDITYTLQYVTEDLHIGGQIRLHEGFCSEWGSLGNRLSTAQIDVTVPAGSAIILAPTLQVQGSLLGVPDLLNISTGVYLDLTIRNPAPR